MWGLAFQISTGTKHMKETANYAAVPAPSTANDHVRFVPVFCCSEVGSRE